MSRVPFIHLPTNQRWMHRTKLKVNQFSTEHLSKNFQLRFHISYLLKWPDRRLEIHDCVFKRHEAHRKKLEFINELPKLLRVLFWFISALCFYSIIRISSIPFAWYIRCRCRFAFVILESEFFFLHLLGFLKMWSRPFCSSGISKKFNEIEKWLQNK